MYMNKPRVIPNRNALLDHNPSPGEAILPRNYGRGPAILLLDLRLSKVFAFEEAERGTTSGRIRELREARRKWLFQPWGNAQLN